MEKKRICVVYFVHSCFFIHISSFSPYLNGSDVISTINQKLSFFFKESITRFAVPMYFIISGIAFFRDYNNKQYFIKAKSRFFTLCVPYLIWNTLWMIFDIVCSYTFISSFFSGREQFSLSIANVIEGIFLYKSNVPFWYIFYLIVFVVLSPVFEAVVRNKYIGIITTILLSILSVVIEFDFHYDAIVYYMLGSLIGKHYFGAVTKKTNRMSQILSVIFLVTYVITKNMVSIYLYDDNLLAKMIVFVLASYSLWSIVDIFIEKIPHSSIYARSFPIYAMHINISAVVYKIAYLILPKSNYSAIPNFIITVIVTITIINVFCVLFEHYLPAAYSLFMRKGVKKRENQNF